MINAHACAKATLAVLLTAGFWFFAIGDADAATIGVNSTADTAADDGQCTLREAITAANTDTASGVNTGECAAGAGADIITLLPGTYTLTTPLPSISTSITINSPDASVTTIDANNTGPVLTVDLNGDLTINNTTLTGGNAFRGGGIYKTGGSLTVAGSIITNNTATNSGGGINNDDGPVTVTTSTINGNTAPYGGGIYAGGTVTVTTSTINGNTARESGGGIYGDGFLTVTGSTITNNTTDGDGAGIYGSESTVAITSSTINGNTAGFDGGGVHNEEGPLTVTNSTISGNTAGGLGGGIRIRTFGTVALVFSTITDNDAPEGSGIYSDSGSNTFTQLSASIVADNTGVGNDLDLEMGATDSFVSGGFNVIGSTSPNTAAFGAPTGDLVGQSNLGLSPLAFNGGSTQTHALDDGNMAVDRVTGPITIGTDQSVDQRGTARPQGPAKDAGAYEGEALVAALCDHQLVTINLATNGGNGAGTPFVDVILGTPTPDTIRGGFGNDTICAGGGGDNVRGGPGDDTIFGEAGADTISGGGGADTIDGGGADDIISGQGGPDTIDGGTGNDTIDGQGAADTISGGAGADAINGQNGADIMRGNGGDDHIKGQTGPDEIRGDADDDDLGGGSGADTFYGGPGTDRCAGNTGPDQAQAATCETTPGIEVLF